MSYLLDTNIISELRKPVPNPGVAAWYGGVAADDLYLSALVVGEVRQGIDRLARRDPVQAAPFERWFARLVGTFADRIVPVTLDAAVIWGRLNVPDPLPVVDGLLAATALAHGWTLVTRNERDVVRSGARVINPFSAAS